MIRPFVYPILHTVHYEGVWGGGFGYYGISLTNERSGDVAEAEVANAVPGDVVCAPYDTVGAAVDTDAYDIFYKHGDRYQSAPSHKVGLHHIDTCLIRGRHIHIGRIEFQMVPVD